MLRDAIQTYHDLLTDEVAAATQAQLDDQQHRRGLYFGTRPLCSVLRPRFLTPDHYRFLRARLATLLRAFDRAYRAALDDAAIRAQFGLFDWEEELLAVDPGFADPSPVSRIDAFYLPDEARFALTEYNAETPAAPAYNDVLSEVFLGLPILRPFLRRYDVRPLPSRKGVLHALLGSYQSFSGGGDAPRIAILDWREVPTYSEFVLFQDYFRSQGLECVIADPREVEYRDGRLVAGDFPITLIYKRVLLSELVDRGGGLDQPVLRAVRDGAVCMVNPPRCKVLHKKLSLAVLSDERNSHLFTPAEAEAIAAHIPWSRRVEERHTTLDGADVDLVPYIAAHPERFVIKANDEYGGKGIVLGWDVDAPTWERAIQTALAEPSLVQERVTVPSEPFPSLVDGRVDVIDRMLDTAPFVCHGAYVDGCLTRLSTQALLNVTAGAGSTVPTFVVEER